MWTFRKSGSRQAPCGAASKVMDMFGIDFRLWPIPGRARPTANRHWRRPYALAGLLVLWLAAPPLGAARAEETGLIQDVDLSAILTMQTALGVEDLIRQRFEWRFEPRAEIGLGDLGRFVAVARAEIEGFDRLEPGRPEQLARAPHNRRLLLGDRSAVELREAYWQGGVGPLSFRLGKQQVVWGTADGLKVLDVVNPQSFRAFILDDFDVSRIPLWTVNVQGRFLGMDVEAVWIPDTTYDELPEPGAVFELTSPLLGPPPLPLDRPLDLRDPVRPDRTVRDSDAGIRFLGFVDGWDVTFLYLRHYEDRPLFQVDVTQTLTTVTPTYNRVNLFGATASKAFGDFVIRTEIGYTTGRGEQVDLARAPTGVGFSDNLSYVIGIDLYSFLTGVLSVQFLQDIVLNDLDGLVPPASQNFVTANWRGQFRNDRLQTDVRLLVNTNEGDGLARFLVRYEVNDLVTLTAGAEKFFGTRDGVFGQFRDRDRITLGLRLGF